MDNAEKEIEELFRGYNSVMLGNLKNAVAFVLRKRDANRCEYCGANVYSGPPDCFRCGAPNCCPQCCQIDTLKSQLHAANEDDEMYKHLWEETKQVYALQVEEANRLRSEIAVRDNQITQLLATNDKHVLEVERLRAEIKSLLSHTTR